MKKRILLFMGILVLFGFGIPAYAQDTRGIPGGSILRSAIDATVCDFRCDYTSIDAVLTDIENGVYDQFDMVSITTSTWNEQSLSNHTLTKAVAISFTYTAGVIDGGGATITTNSPITISGRNVDFKNLNLIFDDLQEEIAVVFSAQNTHVDQVNIASKTPLKCSDYILGVLNDSSNFAMENSTISGFSLGIHSGNNLSIGRSKSIDIYGTKNLSIDHSKLDQNEVSVLALGNGSIANSTISTTFSSGNFAIQDSNDLGSLKVKRISFNEMEDASLCSIASEKYVYVDSSNPFVSVQMKRKMDIDRSEKKQIDNMLVYFKDVDDISLEGFTYTSTDEEIAAVKNGKISILKIGEVSITATNEETNEVYILQLNVTEPSLLTNPITKINYLILIGMIGILAFSAGTYFAIRKEPLS